jgi:hypothetical protein
MNRTVRWIGGLLALGVAIIWSSAASALTQTLDPATCTSVTGIGTVAWTNPGNAVSTDGNYATAKVNNGIVTNYLLCVGYGFTIPAGATINGITVSVTRSSSGAPTGTNDAAVRTVKAGVIGTTDRSTGTTYTNADVVEAHGNAADLWGTTWTPADINNANFGAAFAAVKSGASGGSRTISVDDIQIAVDYTVPVPVVINTYYPGTASLAVGATSIALGTATGAATPIAAGDLLLIMQMQDASIDATNTATYGDGVVGDPGSGATVRSSGLYEYAVAASFAGGTLTLSCGTVNAYNYAAPTGAGGQQRTFQVIRVPVFASYTLGLITAQAWNGGTGGVLAFDVGGVLTLNSATVTVDGMGFRGGAGRSTNGGSGANSDYRTLSTNLANGSKGEGIAGTPYYVFAAPSTLVTTGFEGYPNGSFARGAPGNAGGGGTDINPAGNDENSGGGGGANGGGGGIGGIGWCPAFVNTAPYYGCGIAALASASNPGGSTGGFGGSAVTGLGSTRLTLGGGGGAGTANNGTGALPSSLSDSGAAGGGIIMIRAGSITGAATFNANGSNGDNTVQNDGSGGGGGGGAVLINAGSGMGGVTINVNGGIGGSNLLTGGGGVTPHGPGGGGGGGFAVTTAAPASCNSGGGANGVTFNNSAPFGAYGSTPGGTGSCVGTLTSAQIPGSGTAGVPACPVNHFAIGTGGSSGSTCTAKNITITAQNTTNATVTNYTGTINITTSTAHGSWSKVTAGGTLTQAVADSGAASYQYVSLDNGVATLALTNHHADSNLTVTVVDSALPITSSTSTAITFMDNAFVITNDAVQVAGRPQAMTAAMWRKDTTTGVCAISPFYTGVKNTKTWLTRDVSDPGGAAATIGALSLPNAVPAANNLALTFAAGSASFNLGTADVGKYVLNLRDDSRTFATGVDINGSSGAITTRPFALVISAVKQGAVNNPSNGGPAGTVFAVAGSSFQASVGAYLWNSAADTNVAGGDGIPDAAATLALITAAGPTPSYRWLTTLSAGIPFTPATALDAPVGSGTVGIFSNGGQGGACPAGSPNCFANGIATPNNLSYSEVGSFTLSGVATNFLNSGINLTALVFNNSATPLRNGVVGRFIPDHFDTVVTGGMPCPTGLTCPLLFNGFVYSAEPFMTNVIARNVAGALTANYDGGLGFSKAVTLTAWNALGSAVTQNPSGGTLASNAIPTSAFTSGSTAAGTPGAPTYALPNAFPSATSPPGPTDIYLRAVDTDNVTSLRGGSSIEGGIKIVSGRIQIANAYGSELLMLPIGITVQYWSGTGYVTSLTDIVTTFTASSVGFTNCQTNLSSGAALPNNCKPLVAVTTPPASVSITSGVGGFRLNAPGAGNSGSADLTINAPTYLPSTTARAGFGIYKGGPVIYHREMY